MPIARAARLRRTLAVLLSAVLLLQSVIAGACAAHDAVHGRLGAPGAAGIAAAGDLPDPTPVPMTPDPGEPGSLHALLHAAHCGGCTQSMSGPVQGLLVPACITTAVPATFAACAPIYFPPDPSLRPPISA